MKKYILEIKWALTFVVVSLLWMLLEKLTGLHSEHISKHPTYTNFFAIPAVAVYVFAFLDKQKKSYQGIMSYKEGLKTGIIITIIIAILSPITQSISSLIITPEFFPNVIEYSVTKGLMSVEEAKSFYNLKNYVINATLGSLIMGVITSIVVAFFTKSNNSN